MRVLTITLATTLLLLAGAAHAQQPAPTFVDRVIEGFRAELSGVQANLFVARAQVAQLTEENAKLKSELEELRKKLPAENTGEVQR